MSLYAVRLTEPGLHRLVSHGGGWGGIHLPGSRQVGKRPLGSGDRKRERDTEMGCGGVMETLKALKPLSWLFPSPTTSMDLILF